MKCNTLVISSLCLLVLSPPSLAQVVPTNAATTVRINGNVIKIDGGLSSADRRNLLHDFTEFNVRSGETAWFANTTNRNAQNILVRILGTNPSFIDGLLQSNSNLFLMNPNGIIFGNGAALDVRGIFSASTATSIGFTNGEVLAVGRDFHPPSSNPISLGFPFFSSPIINLADLSNSQGVSFIGGSVLNLGQIEAPQVVLASVDIINGGYKFLDVGNTFTFEKLPDSSRFPASIELGNLETLFSYAGIPIESVGKVVDDGIEINGHLVRDGDTASVFVKNAFLGSLSGDVIDLSKVVIPDPDPSPQPVQPDLEPQTSPGNTSIKFSLATDADVIVRPGWCLSWTVDKRGNQSCLLRYVP